MHVPLNPVVSGRFSFESSSSILIKALDAPLELLAGVSLEEFGAGVSLDEVGAEVSLDEGAGLLDEGAGLLDELEGTLLEELEFACTSLELVSGPLEELAGVSLEEFGTGLLEELGTGSLDGLETDSLSQLIQQRAALERSSFPKSL